MIRSERISILWKRAKASAIAAIAILAAGCTNGRQPSGEFSTYVKAYTGGVISSTSTVKVEFTSGFGADKNASGAITFSPSLKGTSRWVNDKLLEFIPDEGALTPGKVYEASVRLDALAGVREKELKKFVFSFAVAPKIVSLKLDGARISSSDPAVASASGTVRFSSDMPSDEVKNILSFSEEGKNLEVSPLAAGTFSFVISGIERKADDMEFTVSADAGRFGYRKAVSSSVTIPSLKGFRVTDAVCNSSAASPYVEILFSQPLDNTQNPEGLFTLRNVGRTWFDRSGNSMKIYYESYGSRTVDLDIASGVLSIDGDRLGSPYRKSFSSDEALPEVKILANGSIMPDPDNLKLPFTAVNLNAVDLSIVKIYESNVLSFLQDNSLQGDDELRRSGRLVLKTTLRLDGNPDINLKEKNLFSLDLSGMMKKEPGAIYRVRFSFRKEYSLYGTENGTFSTGDGRMVELSATGLTREDEDVWDTPYSHFYENFYDWDEYDWNESENPASASFYMNSDRFPVINLLNSDLGLIVKSADNGRIWVAANDIISTRPVKGAEITAYNFQLQKIGSGKTDSRGIAEIEVSGKPFVVTARDGRTMAYLKVTEGSDNSLSRFDTGGKKVAKGLKGYVYGERGVWRPGDTVHLVLLLEDRESRLPEGHPVTMEIYTPQGQFYDKQILSGGADGFTAFEFTTLENDPTGTWHAYFKVGGATFHKALSIETVKPNRLKINVRTSDRTLASGKTVNFDISSNWLTGPAASGMRTTVEMTLSRGSGSFDAYKGYIFKDPAKDFSPEEYNVLDRTLGNNGNISVDVRMPQVSNAPGMLKASLVTRVFEPGGDASITGTSMDFSPYTSYVGIKSPSAEDNRLETDIDHKFKIVVVDKDGRKQPGHTLSYKVYKLDWSWWWESRSQSYDSYVNSRFANTVSEGTVTATDGEASFNFRVDYPDWGRYLVYVKDPVSGHATGDVVYIDWPSWRGRSDKSDPSGLNMLSFTTDRSSCKVGDDVTVYIPAAKGGRALVSLENGSGVISQTWVNTSDIETRYTFTVTSEMAPDFYIHITQLQPHSRTGNDLPMRMYGVQTVMVTDEASHLSPEIIMPDVVRPQEEFTIKVRESGNRPMTYTLAIVDEGLLDITSFKTPDPWNAMYAKEALGVRTWDLYDDVIGAFNGSYSSLLSVGGDESISKEKVQDNRFNPVVRFMGPFTLKGGSDTHRITLPMYVGSVRVMLVAGKDGAYGNAEKTVPVRSPLMVLSSLPRVIGCGEELTLPVNVFAMEDGISDVKVSVRAEGPVKLNENCRNLKFSGAGDQIARFGLKASDIEGTVRFTITAEAAGHKATEEVSVEVRNPNPMIASIDRRIIPAGKSETFSWNGAETRTASLEMAGFPSIDVNGMFNYVKDYSYCCTEQLSSRGLALVSTLDLLNGENAEKAREMIPAILQQLYGRQLADGGFAYWNGSSVANEWATSMAGHFMKVASDRGFKVDAGVFNAWKNFQKKTVVNYRKSNSANLDDLQQAYRLYTLALAGAADEGAMNRLKLEEKLSVQAAWRLAAAYAVRGKGNIAKEMVGNLSTDIESYRDNSTFGSSTRDKAMILETLILTDDIAGAMAVAQDVADGLGKESYSTQTAAFGSVAMGRLAGKISTDALSADVDGKEVKFAGALYATQIDAAAGKVTVRNNGSADIFVGVTTSFQPSFGTPTEAASAGISISRSFVDASGKTVDASSIRQGSDFYEKIEVCNTGNSALDNLALTQMIPSGWEIFNERLYGYSSKSESEFDSKDIRDDRVDWFFSLSAGSRKTFWVRLQASYEGTFILPAAACSAMYDNSVAANTASGTASVKR